MHWVTLLPLVIGFVIMMSIPILLIVIPLKWGKQIPISQSNFWIAAVFSVIPIIGYVVIAFNQKDLSSNLLFGNLLFCIIGGLIATGAVFLSGPLREYYAKAWMGLAEAQKSKADKSDNDR